MFASKNVTAVDWNPPGIALLIYRRLLLKNPSARSLKDELAVTVDLQAAYTIEAELNLVRPGAGRNHEVVFELPLVPVVNEIHSRINIGVPNPRVTGNVSTPRSRIVPL